jgi:hypothetical protein
MRPLPFGGGGRLGFSPWADSLDDGLRDRYEVLGGGYDIRRRCLKDCKLSCVINVSATSTFECRDDVQSVSESHFDNCS